MHKIKANGDQPATVRSYWNMACPKCGEDSGLIIVAHTKYRLLPDGTEDVDADSGWCGNSIMSCEDCGFLGEANVFSITAQAER